MKAKGKALDMEAGTKLHVYKCPSCAGAVKYDAATGKLTCLWCGNRYEAAQLEVKEVCSALQGHVCPECGSKLMLDDFMASVTCPYCGNNEIAPQRFEDDFQPDFIIPFKVTKRQALDCYNEMLKEKEYLPDDYAREARIISVQGTYVPFWLCNGTVDFDFTHYCSTGGKYAVTCNERRAGTYSFGRVPADGSERMRDDMMDSIEPYEYGELVPFTADYLPGFLAERYTVAENEVAARIDRRVKNSAMHAAADTIEGNWKIMYPEEKRSCATVEYGKAEQAMLPVWLIVVSYRGGKYLVGVNGQTGKVAVNLPIDKGKQGRVVRKATVSDILMTLSVFAVAALLIVVPLVKEGVDFTKLNFSALTARDISFGMSIVVAFTIMLVAFAVGAYISAKRKVKDAMHNVEEASDADDFIQEGHLALTLSAKEKGPEQLENNWPER